MGLFDRLKKRRGAGAPYCAAVVPAAGSAVRMEGIDKIMAPLGDWPVLVHTLRALSASANIAEIVVVTREDQLVPVSQLCKDFALDKVTKVVVGGDDRTQSVLSGVREVSQRAELVAVHDGARPLVDVDVIDSAILRSAQCGAAAPAVPVKDTVKRVSGGVVEATLDREGLYAVQTPQVFQRDLLLGALQKAVDDGVSLTDDCAAVERIGMTVALTAGSYENIKITTPVDLLIAQAILSGRDEA